MLAPLDIARLLAPLHAPPSAQPVLVMALALAFAGVIVAAGGRSRPIRPWRRRW